MATADRLFPRLLYLAWQKQGQYKNIEQAWGQSCPGYCLQSSYYVAEHAPEYKRSLRAIVEKLRSIPKDIDAVGLRKFFESAATARRKPEKPVEGDLVLRPTIKVTQPIIKRTLALPGPEQIRANQSTEEPTTLDIDDLAVAVNRDEAGAQSPSTKAHVSEISIDMPSAPNNKKDHVPPPRQQPKGQPPRHNCSSKRKDLSSLPNSKENDAEGSDCMPGPSKRRKDNEDFTYRPGMSPSFLLGCEDFEVEQLIVGT